MPRAIGWRPTQMRSVKLLCCDGTARIFSTRNMLFIVTYKESRSRCCQQGCRSIWGRHMRDERPLGLHCRSWEQSRMQCPTTKVSRTLPLEFLCSWRHLLHTAGLMAAPTPGRRPGRRAFPEQGWPGRLVTWEARSTSAELPPYPINKSIDFAAPTQTLVGYPSPTMHPPAPHSLLQARNRTML